MQEVTKIHTHIPATAVQPFALDESDYQKPAELAQSLRLIGINFGSHANALPNYASQMTRGLGMDAVDGNAITIPGIPALIQNLQGWLPGVVSALTTVRTIDKLVGITTVADFEDEQIVQPFKENMGRVAPYGDATNMPEATWNANYIYRSIVRFEFGFTIGRLEEGRDAKMKFSSANEKRNSVMLAHEINRNLVGFYGYNNGLALTYGLLNDPALLAYVSDSVGASGSSNWATKTFQELVTSLNNAASLARTQSGGNFDPMEMPSVCAIALNKIQYLQTVPTQYGGTSVMEWAKKTFPKMRFVGVPQFQAANNGSDVLYLFPDEVPDEFSTDDKRVFIQAVPAKIKALGVEQRVKGYAEDYASATAGIMCKRPLVVVRITGI